VAIGAAVRARAVVLDREIACLHHDGRPDFNGLFFRRSAPVFYAFDCVWLDGRDLRARPLVQRKKALRRVVPRRADRLRYLDGVVGRGVDLFRAVCELDMEGIVAKRLDGIYDPTATTWLKVKNLNYSQARDRHELFERRAVGGRR
jgi:bifunctional non-homologous end joining protein LigD